MTQLSEQMTQLSEQMVEMREELSSWADNVGALVEVAAADAVAPRGSKYRPRDVVAERLRQLVVLMGPLLGGGNDDADTAALRCARTLCDDVAAAEAVRHVRWLQCVFAQRLTGVRMRPVAPPAPGVACGRERAARALTPPRSCQEAHRIVFV